jgi:two-component sensor histidine kinase
MPDLVDTAPRERKNSASVVGLIRSRDWTATSLGEPLAWPSRLQHLVELMFGSRVPSFVLCGLDRILIYNEAFATICGAKHPAAFGRPASEAIPNLWSILRPHCEKAFGGEPVEISQIEWRPPGQAGWTLQVVLTPLRDGLSPVTWVHCQITLVEPLAGSNGDVPVDNPRGTDNDRGLVRSQAVLIRELQHRTRNLIGVIGSLMRRTIEGSASLQDFQERFERRLAALARVQDLLSRDVPDPGLTFDELVRAELSAHGGAEGEQITLDGPPGIWLPCDTVHTFALAIHELATNASKYGALSNGGHLLVRWGLHDTTDSDEALLRVEWIESGVRIPPSSSRRSRGGYGRELIERALPYQLNARTSFEIGADGVRCSIELPIRRATPSRQA